MFTFVPAQTSMNIHTLVYTYLIYHFPLKRLPLTLYSSSVDRGHVHQTDKSNNQSLYLFPSISPLLDESRAYFSDNVAGIAQAAFCVTINSGRTVR